MRFTAIILALLLSAPTMAHQLKASVTTVLFNKRTNNIELMHRFYLHDTEHAVEHLFDGNADILSNKEDQKRFADYVESHIALQTLGGKPLELKDVGAQVDGKFFWVYQEVTIPEGIHGIRMSNGALRDLWPAHPAQGQSSVQQWQAAAEQQAIALEVSLAKPGSSPLEQGNPCRIRRYRAL